MILKTRKKQLKRSKIDNLKEECGVFGISDHSDASALVALGLHALQHRGQEGCGIVSFDGKNFHSEKRLGLVGDNFTKGNVIDGTFSYSGSANRFRHNQIAVSWNDPDDGFKQFLTIAAACEQEHKTECPEEVTCKEPEAVTTKCIAIAS